MNLKDNCVIQFRPVGKKIEDNGGTERQKE